MWECLLLRIWWRPQWRPSMSTPRRTLERVWQSLFAVLGEVLGSKGDNSYKLPHLGKENLRRTGKLPVNGRVDEEKYRVGITFWEAS
ncbi:unnamed protein product, partial [Discosporangium mesarthrocarpum]